MRKKSDLDTSVLSIADFDTNITQIEVYGNQTCTSCDVVVVTFDLVDQKSGNNVKENASNNKKTKKKDLLWMWNNSVCCSLCIRNKTCNFLNDCRVFGEWHNHNQTRLLKRFGECFVPQLCNIKAERERSMLDRHSTNMSYLKKTHTFWRISSSKWKKRQFPCSLLSFCFFPFLRISTSS